MSESNEPNFTLANDAENLLTAAELARRLKVSKQTVYNLEALGMVPAKTNADGVKMWDPAKAEEFRSKQAPELRHGGKREGAGRRVGGEKSQQEEKSKQPLPGESLAGMFDKARAIADVAGAEGVSSRSDFQQAFGDLLLEKAMKGDAARLDIANFSDAVTAQESLLKLRQLEGTLVDVEAVKSALGQFTTTIRLAMEAYPARVAGEIIAEFRIDPKELSRVKSVLAQAMRHVMRQIAAEPLIGKQASGTGHQASGGEKEFTTESTEAEGIGQ